MHCDDGNFRNTLQFNEFMVSYNSVVVPELFPKGPHIVIYILGLPVFLVALLIASYIYDILKKLLKRRRKQ